MDKLGFNLDDRYNVTSQSTFAFIRDFTPHGSKRAENIAAFERKGVGSAFLNLVLQDLKTNWDCSLVLCKTDTPSARKFFGEKHQWDLIYFERFLGEYFVIDLESIKICQDNHWIN